MTSHPTSINVFITSPLEQVHIDRIKAVSPQHVNVIYDPELLPPTRYTADHKGDEHFVRTPEQEERWRSHLATAHILWDFPVRAVDGGSDFASAPNVKWVQTTSSGVGQLVKNLGLQDSNLQITTARGIHARPLTDFTFAIILSHYKQLGYLESEKNIRRWERYCGTGVAGKTLAVIGAGGVGRQVLAAGNVFGMRTVALASPSSTHTAQDLGADHLYPAEKLHEMLGETDVLVLSMPHTPDTERLMDRDAIAALKPGGILINIARGQVLDEAALIDALKTDHIALAALDVFDVEPLPKSSPLWDLPNVIISPHSASTVEQENAIITDIFCHNLRCYLHGNMDKMTNIIDKQKMY